MMENALTLKFYQRSVSIVNSGTIEMTLLNILIGKRSIFHCALRMFTHLAIHFFIYVGDGDTKHVDMGNFNLILLAYFAHMRSFVLAFRNFAFFQFLIFQKK